MENKKRIENKIMENIIQSTRMAPYFENNKAIDFKSGDVVRCSYMKGIFRVSQPMDTGAVAIYNVDLSGELLFVGPECLEKIAVNEETLKVLYGD